MPLSVALQRVVDGNPVPEIFDPDMEEKVFTHRSLYPTPAHIQITEHEPRDWERLAFLGDQILSMCTTDIIFERYPCGRTSYLTGKRNAVVNNDQVAKWSQAYGFPARIRCDPSQHHLMRNSQKAWASVFEAFVGAVFLDSGLERAQAWIKPLILRALDDSDERERNEEEEDLPDNGEYGKWPPDDEGLNPLQRFDSTSATGFMPSEEIYDKEGETFVNTFHNQMSFQKPSERTAPNTPRGHGPEFPSAMPPNEAFGSRTSHLGNVTGIGVSSTRGALWFRPEGGPSTGNPSPTQSVINPISPKGPSPLSKMSTFAPFSPSAVTSSNTISTGSGSSHFTTSSNSSSTATGPSSIYTALPVFASSSVSRGNAASAEFSSSSIPPGYMAAPANQGSGFLALFNQIASQKRINPHWETSQSGPDHRPAFYAKVSVHNVMQGEGRAFNKQTAKQLAAKQAMIKLRWHAE